jgi:hypothetical protein
VAIDELARLRKRRISKRACSKCWKPYALTLRGKEILCRFCGHVRVTLTDAAALVPEPRESDDLVIDLRGR